jgi:hypothetical protein
MTEIDKVEIIIVLIIYGNYYLKIKSIPYGLQDKQQVIGQI